MLTLARTAVPDPRQAVRRAGFPWTAPSVPAGLEPPKRRSTVGADYDTRWARSYPARLARLVLSTAVVRPGLELLTNPEIIGTDRLADLSGPVVFAANHHSHVDTPLLAATIPEPWRHRLVIGAAADYFFGNRVTAPLSALVVGAIPIERQKVNRRSADDAAEMLDEGWSLLIFPEGGRSPDGWGQPFRGGAAYLSVRCSVPVVPIHIEGTDRVLPKGRNLPRRSKVRVTFGSPLWAEDGEETRRFGARIEREVATLADEVNTDWWSARRRAHAGETPSLQGPDTGAWRRAWNRGDRSPKRRAAPAWPPLD
jgi:1-acyl-sn-glycerol-3-phosphate acyltransferase